MEVWYKRAGQGGAYEPKLDVNFGTGFIIRYGNRDYLVTAKHVADFLRGDGELVMNIPQGTTTSVSFGDMKKSRAFQGITWFSHPSADVAVCPILFEQKVDHSHFPSEAIPRIDEPMPLLSTVYVLGFPQGLGVGNRLTPIAKKAQIASAVTSLEALDIKYRGIKFVLLDQALAQGYSGAPVFFIEEVMASNVTPPIKVGERVHLAGIASLQIGDQSGGKIAAIVPISYLWEILESRDFAQHVKGPLSK